MAADIFDLDTPLMEFPGQEGSDIWTIRQAVEGVQIFGGIGSGKTSGSGRMIARKFLSKDFGGLVLTTKPDEREMWEDYCRQTNRLDDLIVVEPGGTHFFNFLEYESACGEGQRPSTDNIVQVLKTVIRADEEKSGGKSDDPFWETALDMLIGNIIDLCLLAYGKVSVQMLYNIAQCLPSKDKPDVSQEEDEKKQNAFFKAYYAARVKVSNQLEKFISTLPVPFDYPDTYDDMLCEGVSDYRLLKIVDQFFHETFMNLSEKTRSIVEFSFSGFLYSLMREPVFSLFCRHPSTFTPKDSLDGKIILLNVPVKRYHKVGRNSQILFKYIWQREMEKRNIHENGRPVFLWADEAQNFIHEYDAEYQATARSSRIATVYISQNLPNYHANMGGAKSEFRVKSFLGTLGTKIFHANADIETNRYASELIGDGYFEETSTTNTASGTFSASQTVSGKLRRIVRPEDFARLKTGGPLNDFKTEGYMHLQGSVFKKGDSHKKIIFNQNFSHH